MRYNFCLRESVIDSVKIQFWITITVTSRIKDTFGIEVTIRFRFTFNI